MVTAVADETRRVLSMNRPVAASYVSTASPQVDRDPRLVRLKAERDDGRGGQFGVILGVDRGRLVQLGRQYDCVLEVLPKVGEYLPTGAALVAVHGGDGPTEDAVRGCVRLGRSRAMYQDPLYGIRQLVDVASQALSPAVNQPTTAVVVIDRLEELLLRIGRRPQPTGFFVDSDGWCGSFILSRRGPKLSTWRSRRSLSMGRPRPLSRDGLRRDTSVCTSPSPSICAWTSLGTSLSSKFWPVERSRPSIPWLLLAPIHADLAEDADDPKRSVADVHRVRAKQLKAPSQRRKPECGPG